MLADLHATLENIDRGHSNSGERMDRAIASAQDARCAHVFIKTMFDEARAVAADPANRKRPLGGLAVSVKDLFDLAGQPTPAGSMVLADAPPAAQDSLAVARLKAAGASIIGRSNMTEFAYSGVGVNPHFGTPLNPAGSMTSGGPAAPRIPGGSSSGAAVSVATGAAYIGLGSDTGGSIRIPAALCGIVGFKNTARLTPLQGALPLSPTLDTVCAMTRSVRDAILAHEILAARRIVRSRAPLAAYRLAVPRTAMLDGLDSAVASAFENSLRRLRAAGAHIEDILLPELQDLGALQSSGGFAAAESYAWHRTLLARRGDDYDPRVRSRIERGAAVKAHEYIALLAARRKWISRIESRLQGFDAALSPTVPITAPPIAQLAPKAGLDAVQDVVRDREFFRVNALLLRNPSVVNMLDGCAISIPCQATGELPVGLMIWQGAMRDDTVLNIALLAEAVLRDTAGEARDGGGLHKGQA